jgi:uncharacterized C2H2 Zn-finger protein
MDKRVAAGLAVAGLGIGGYVAYKLLTKPPVPEKYTCPYCGAEFSSASELNEHIAKVHQAAPPTVYYKCPYCGAMFTSQDMLNKHISEAHQQPPPPTSTTLYICPYCGAKFTSEADLKRHIEQAHSTPPPVTYYVCPYCGAKFTSYDELNQHISQVHQQPPVTTKYVCPYCGATFSTADALTQHIDTVHKPKEPTIYTCPVCGAQFTNEQDYLLHTQTAHVAPPPPPPPPPVYEAKVDPLQVYFYWTCDDDYSGAYPRIIIHVYARFMSSYVRVFRAKARVSVDGMSKEDGYPHPPVGESVGDFDFMITKQPAFGERTVKVTITIDAYAEDDYGYTVTYHDSVTRDVWCPYAEYWGW